MIDKPIQLSSITIQSIGYNKPIDILPHGASQVKNLLTTPQNKIFSQEQDQPEDQPHLKVENKINLKANASHLHLKDQSSGKCTSSCVNLRIRRPGKYFPVSKTFPRPRSRSSRIDHLQSSREIFNYRQIPAENDTHI